MAGSIIPVFNERQFTFSGGDRTVVAVAFVQGERSRLGITPSTAPVDATVGCEWALRRMS